MDMLDLNLIATDCKLNEDVDAKIIVECIDKLATNYDEENLVTIYNHFLGVAKNPDIIMHVIRLADKIRDKSTLGALKDILLDRENTDNVRAMCAKAIANLKDTSAVVPLLYCLNNKDENYKVRLACADALGRIGDRYAVAPLIDLVTDEDEKSVYLRESAASALGMLGDIRAVDPLVAILETKKGIIDKFTFLKERAIEALSKLHTSNDRVFKALKNSLMDESPQIRINAIEALMESDDDRACDLIKTCLADEDEEVKKNALIALYNLIGVDVLNEVIESVDYCEFLKQEAKNIYDEYEVEND